MCLDVSEICAQTWVVIMDFDVVLSVGGNSKETSIFGDLASIGAIGAKQNPSIVAALSDVLEKHMRIPNARIFFNVRFPPLEMWFLTSGKTPHVLSIRNVYHAYDSEQPAFAFSSMNYTYHLGPEIMSL